MRRLTACIAIALTALLFQAGPASALFLENSESTEGLGSFVADLSYAPVSPTEAELMLVISNVSDPQNGGYITAFALNNPHNRITGVETLEFPKGFRLLSGNEPFDGVKASPYGAFDFGAALGKDFLGGGSPVNGISTESGRNTKVFRFRLTGNGLDELDEQSFAEELSLPQGGVGQNYFVVRFKGFANDASDKVAGANWWGPLD